MSETEQIPPEIVAVINKSKLMDEMLNSEAGRPILLEAVKAVRPTLRIPERDIPADVEKRVSEKYEAELKSLREDIKALGGAQSARDKADKASRYDLDESAVAEVEKLQKERGINDYDTALEFYSLTRRASEPSHYTPTSPLTLPDQKGLFEDPVAWSRKTAHDVINEITAARRGR